MSTQAAIEFIKRVDSEPRLQEEMKRLPAEDIWSLIDLGKRE